MVAKLGSKSGFMKIMKLNADYKIEFFSVILFIIGCVCDHVTTAYGLTLPSIKEMNTNVVILMSYGTWHMIEALIICTGVVSWYLAVQSNSERFMRASGISLGIGGLLRFSAGIQNVTVILNVLS